MSRSVRRGPFKGLPGHRSEKDDKARAHRRLRVAERAMTEDAVAPTLRDVSNRWLFSKDDQQRVFPPPVGK